MSERQGLPYLGGTDGNPGHSSRTSRKRHIRFQGQRADRPAFQAQRSAERGYAVRAKHVAAHAVVVPDDKAGSPVLPDKHIPYIAPRIHRGELSGEVQHLYPVNSEGAQHRGLLLIGREQPERPRILLEHGPGVVPESYDNRLFPLAAGGRDESPYNFTVSEVDAVKETCRYYSHFTRGKSCLCGRRGFFG